MDERKEIPSYDTKDEEWKMDPCEVSMVIKCYSTQNHGLKYIERLDSNSKEMEILEKVVVVNPSLREEVGGDDFPYRIESCKEGD